MQNNFIEKISPSIRIIILIILIISLFLAKSIYLILFITTLIFILLIITNKKVNIYVKFFKKTFLLLLFFFIIYIIIFRKYDIVSIVLIVYKLIASNLLINIFILNINFRSLHAGIYGCLLPLKRIKNNIEVFSFEIVLSIYFIKFLLESTDKIKCVQLINGKRKKNIKNYFIPSFICAINDLEKLQDSLKIKFYKLNYKKSDLKSKLILIFFIIFFVVCMFKEVIL